MGKYENEKVRRNLARELSRESIVLLENKDCCLPLNKGQKVAVFGRTQNEIIIGGGGSGASVSDHVLPLMDELKKAGLNVNSELENYYLGRYAFEKENRDESNEIDLSKLAGLVASGMIYELFGKYNGVKEEYIPDSEMVKRASCDGSTAIYVLGRATGGEECDRRVNNDYYLDESEIKLVELITSFFDKVIVVYNINGLVDMTWMKRYPQIKAAVFMGTLGEQASGALADILTGVVSPSGKLSQTVACSYEEYPTASHFSFNKDDPTNIKTYKDYGLDAEANGSSGFDVSPVTVYAEDIFVGYRYFNSFGKPVLYPFGYGLSFASFDWKIKEAYSDAGIITVKVIVTNTSNKYAGREVIQLYSSKPDSDVTRSSVELRAYAKTKKLMPGECEEITLQFFTKDISYFSEEKMAYVIEAGKYELRIGTDSRNNEPAVSLNVPCEMIINKVSAGIGLNKANEGKINFIRPENINRNYSTEVLPEITITEDMVFVPDNVYERAKPDEASVTSTLEDVVSGKVTMGQFINQMSIEELAVLCNGYGPGLPFGGIGMELPNTIKDKDGNDIAYNSHKTAPNGYINPAISKYGIPSCFYKDGPASVGKTAWPTGMMLSCTFDLDLLYEFGWACGEEAASQNVSSWLAPGMNIIRNPIEGRAFEYFSEDPLVCGLCGTAIALGAMENNKITVCPKHFALNEQETYRRGKANKNIDAVDSIVSARAAREIYLKPFETVITIARPTTVMTSFNKINGVFAAGNYNLNTLILRNEWGYDGVVVTDWGDMDIVVDGADAVAAGNDVIMPGGPPVIEQVLRGYKEGRVSENELKTAVWHLMNFIKKQI